MKKFDRKQIYMLLPLTSALYYIILYFVILYITLITIRIKLLIIIISNKFQQNTTKIDQSEIVEGSHFVLPYTQHLQYIFINLKCFALNALSICMLRWTNYTFIENCE